MGFSWRVLVARVEIRFRKLNQWFGNIDAVIDDALDRYEMKLNRISFILMGCCVLYWIWHLGIYFLKKL